MSRVVIIGGGFGGMKAAQKLRHESVDVTLLDRRNFHLFQPLLYQVATGALSPGEVASPLRAVLRRQKNARVLLGEAVDLDAHARKLKIKCNDLDVSVCISGQEFDLDYDTLIVATGAQNFYFGHKNWPAIAPGLKSVEDATAMRHKILYAFEAAEREPDPAQRAAWLTFVIVGGGPTGVELSGALAEIAKDTLRHDFRSIRPQDSRILLLEGGAQHVLPTYSAKSSLAAERKLIKLGVRPRRAMVIDIDCDGVTLEGGERIASKTVLWAAGVTPTDFGKILESRAGAALDRHGRVMVDADLTVAGHPEIFVIGDLANVDHLGTQVPGVAPAAMQMGEYAAETIRNRLRGRATRPFHYRNEGSLAVIGRGAAVFELGPLHLHGFIAWVLWLFIHLMYLVQFQNRVIVLIHWGFQYISFDRGARLITHASPQKTSEKTGEKTPEKMPTGVLR